MEILHIESTSHTPLCKCQRQSGNTVRAKDRDDGRFFLSLSTRTALERDGLTLRITLSLTQADRFQAGLSTLSAISLCFSHAWSTREWENVAPKSVHCRITRNDVYSIFIESEYRLQQLIILSHCQCCGRKLYSQLYDAWKIARCLVNGLTVIYVPERYLNNLYHFLTMHWTEI